MADDGAPVRYGDWEQVALVNKFYEAEFMAGRLQSAGIDAQVLDQSFEQIPLTNVSDFEVLRVLVPMGKAEEARRILSEAAPLPADVDVPAEESEVPVPALDEPPSKE